MSTFLGARDNGAMAESDALHDPTTAAAVLAAGNGDVGAVRAFLVDGGDPSTVDAYRGYPHIRN
jgi:hypothetical protein